MREKKIFDQIVWLGGELVNVLGPKLEFNNCSVNSKADARGMVFSGVVMIGGVFDQKIRLEDFPFQKIHFRDGVQNSRKRGQSKQGSQRWMSP
ncbi:hypothetical protein [Ralstonia pseudosolanacearum]|uniref:hypothetical protein n=1 Tax=Ralstonia pseudosolanacearum TaxID=1310165 RepID=UPI0012ED7858|nr:hypothetical protein [Ralstonia pseudosolanacearum]MDC6286615.1 hypothetical protein [Ralstonia pseudosolanacearum]